MLFAQSDGFHLATALMAGLLAATALIVLCVALLGIIRNPALGPGARLGWALVAIAIPLFGPIAYLLLVPRTPIHGTRAGPRGA